MKFESYIHVVTWNSIHLFTFFCYWQYSIELMIGENLINTGDSIPTIVTLDKTVNFFVKGYYA